MIYEGIVLNMKEGDEDGAWRCTQEKYFTCIIMSYV